jgi:hypothetical protein
MESDHSEVLAPYMRVMHVLDCVPGYAGDPRTPAPKGGRESITILTLSFRSEVEQPIMLSMRDTRKLATALNEILSQRDSVTQDDSPQGGETWKEPAEGNGQSDPNAWPADWDEDNEDDWIAKAAADLAKDDPPRVGDLPSTGIRMRIHYRKGKPLSEVEVLGVYYDRKVRLVLYRSSQPDEGDNVIKMDTKGTVLMGCVGPDHYLPLTEWKRYGRLPDGAKFRINGRTHYKMGLKSVKKLLDNKVFTSDFY